ncbi:hypothetical protein BU204_29010 [Actinophytocola xanthii]|uniref:Uncharacterized protein n=2 Tax=Actinophytocola xanthii TaxID=1912961 RepID=A0A1Q8CDV4_9PSEU|nr:hypothetical protein BU204_29010 [Actinophytocola xanthii]
MTGEFPARADRSGDGLFAGTVTVASTDRTVAGVTTPAAEVYVTAGGEVVAVPLAQDLVGRMIRLGPGERQVFPAAGSLRHCATGEALPAGRYEVFAVVVVNSGDGQAVVVGGPWPLEVG